jgi:hypothetical protein
VGSICLKYALGVPLVYPVLAIACGDEFGEKFISGPEEGIGGSGFWHKTPFYFFCNILHNPFFVNIFFAALAKIFLDFFVVVYYYVDMAKETKMNF